MAFVLYETDESRRSTTVPPTIEVVMQAEGEENEWIVRQNVYWGTPTHYYHQLGTLYRQDLALEPIGHRLYRVTIPYGLRKIESGTFTLSFDTGGASINVRAAIEHVADYGITTNNTNPYKGAINATPEGVQGCDILIPGLRLTYTYTHPKGFITESQIKALAAYTGRTNSAPWRTYAAGELLFAGASGQDGTESDASIAYNFIASQNATGLTIGEITGIAKKGHDYLWVEFEDKVVSGQAARTPRRVHIERVYDAINFASSLGWE